LIRHLILPEDQAGTQRIFEFIAHELSKNTYLNIMDQYRPAYRARSLKAINRRINQDEYQAALDLAHELGLDRLDHKSVYLFY
jgi:putative pyruvate formate lyase activating enzyme